MRGRSRSISLMKAPIASWPQPRSLAPHTGEGEQPSSTLWWLFDPVVRTRAVQWKSDESTKHYLTPMLLAINWRCWQAGKIHACVWRFKIALVQARFIEIHQVFAKQKVGYFSSRVVLYYARILGYASSCTVDLPCHTASSLKHNELLIIHNSTVE